MEKSEVIQKIICTFLWSENLRFYIFTSENIKYTIYINNIFLYFTTLYIINRNYYDLLYVSFHIIPRINLRLPYQPETPISARDSRISQRAEGPRADTGVEG